MKPFILFALAFLFALSGCYTTDTNKVNQGPERDLYDVTTTEFLISEGLATEFNLLFFEERTTDSTYNISIHKYIMEDGTEMYMLTVLDMDYNEDDYEEILIKFNDTVHEILCEKINRQVNDDGTVWETAFVNLDWHLVLKLRLCESLVIQAGNHFSRIPPEGISQIQEFIQ